MNSEPTVLDFVKAILTPWRGAPPRIPPLESSDVLETDSIGLSGLPPSQLNGNVADQTEHQTPVQPAIRTLAWPWRAMIALGLALFAQLSLEPSVDRSWQLGVILYIMAAGWVVWANISQEWDLPAGSSLEPRSDPMTIQNVYLIIGLVMSLLAFLTLGGNRFTSLNVLLWILWLAFPHPGFLAARQFKKQMVRLHARSIQVSGLEFTHFPLDIGVPISNRICALFPSVSFE